VLEVVEKLCSHLLILRQGRLVAYDSVSAVREMTGLATLEDSFSHLVEEQDAEEIAHNIVEVMGGR
jgi:ABC-type Na+ transport system ATPase subunit NatA